MSARVLVVDDIEANRKLLQAKLSNEYFHVITAVDGEDGIERAIAEEPDVILMDVMMPKLDGVEACRRLKFDPRTEHIPIVLVTALNEREDRLRGLGAGADDFLTKPVNDLQLLSRVRALTKYKMVADELRKREASGKRIGVIDVVVSGKANEPARILVVDENERQARRMLDDPRAIAPRSLSVRFDMSSTTTCVHSVPSSVSCRPRAARRVARLHAVCSASWHISKGRKLAATAPQNDMNAVSPILSDY